MFGIFLDANLKLLSISFPVTKRTELTPSVFNFFFNREVFDYIDNRENCIFEKEPLQNLSKNGQLMAYKHEGFWHPMDTLRDKNYLNKLCKKKKLNWLK